MPRNLQLEAIASNPTRRIALEFKATGGVGPSPADQTFLSNLNPQYAKLKVTPVGDAFGPLAEGRRAQETRTALQNGLSAVAPPELLTVYLADKGASQEDIRFQVAAGIERLPGFYVQSSDANQPESFLYKLKVNWKFAIVLDGKPLGAFSLSSEPASHVSYSVDPADPDWAPYSIMMDSAADNFSRTIVGRLGLVPPPEKDSYNFTPNEPVAPSTQSSSTPAL